VTSTILPHDELLDCTVRLPDHVVYRDMVTETVVLNLETGRYHGLNPSGGRILRALAESSLNVREAARVLAAEFDAPDDAVERDVCDFCSDLAARGLIELRRDPRA
jgi:hypothetical protein